VASTSTAPLTDERRELLSASNITHGIVFGLGQPATNRRPVVINAEPPIRFDGVRGDR
jgi:hypothetical protein